MTAVAPIPRRRRAAPAAPAPAEHSAAPPPDPSAHRLPFRPDVEGLRAVAILTVVAYHAGVPGMRGGFVGVDVFFVVSGYLITSLLLAELGATGTVGIAAFYARRIRRLFPALSAMVIGTLLLSALAFPPHRVAAIAESARAAAVWSSNLLFASRATDYFASGTAGNPLLHTWSLAVEEQFYLVWPALVLVGAGRRGDRRRLGTLLGAVAVASLAASWWYTRVRQPTAFYGTPMRAWEFAVGALVALPRGGVLARAATGRRFWMAADIGGWAGLALMTFAAVVFSDRTSFPGIHAALPVLGAALVVACASVAPRGSVARALAAPPMQWIGRHSYGWYLWHWPLLVVGAALLPASGVAVRIALAVAGLALAVVTRRAIEEPFRHARRWRNDPRPVVVLGLASAAAIFLGASLLRDGAARAADSPALRAVAFARRDVPRIYGDGCASRDATDSVARVCEYGSFARGAPVMLLFGDSHAAQWFPALEAIARDRGWRLLVLTKSGCPAADVPVYEPSLNRVSLECGAWRRAAFDSARARRPEIVFVGSSSEYVYGNPYPEPRESVTPADWERGMQRALASLGGAGVITMLIEDTPVAPENVPSCLALAAWRRQASGRCDFAAERGRHPWAAGANRRAARAVPGSRAVDLTALVCPNGTCAARRGEVVMYRDARHLTSRGVAIVARGFGEVVDDAIARRQITP